jgi:peptide deformylase
MAQAFDLEAWLAAAPSPAPIVQAGTVLLRRPSPEVPAALFGTPAFDRLIEIMVETMRAAPGVGLAAPQIGVPLRVFVAEDDPEKLAAVSEESKQERARVALPLTVMVNPVITLVAGTEATFYEGCLSVRGYAALVTRATAVSIAGIDARGNPASMQLEGWPSRIMQHETDHLAGVLYVDRMITRSFASETEFASLGEKSVAEILEDLAGA